MTSLPTSKDRFTALDTLAVVRELRQLRAVHLDKVFDLPGGGWSLVLRAAGLGRRELVFVPGRYAALLGSGPEHAEDLSSVTRELRRLLTGATLRSVSDPGGERILELVWGRASEPSELRLILEIFGTGNLLLVREGKIVVVANPRRWSHRTVRTGAEYVPPPVRSDPWTLGASEIATELERSRTDIASTLAARLSLGGPIAEEIIARGAWNPAEAAAPRARELAPRLHAELARLIGEVGEQPSGFVYRHDGAPVDATPYRSHRWSSAPETEVAERPTFSEAAQEYFATMIRPGPTPEDAAAARARGSLERLQEQQRHAIEELTGAIATLKRQAEAIYAHYPEAERVLAASDGPAGEGPTCEVVLGGTPVTLRRDRSPRESAQEIYEEVKRAQSKLLGARAALAETELRLAGPAPSASAPASLAAAEGGTRTRVHWFEKFRWFVSSEGAVVVGGRDAASNDLVVKRHLKETDLYVHADLHGAASVVIKHPPAGSPDLTETTFREAGQWAVAFSKAWRAGLASASAFWVSADQVSKSSESGEFVARGAWIIRGTKHVLRDLPLELALGLIDYEGETRWTVAPAGAVRRRGEVRALLTPGEERERSDREKELVRDLGIPRPLLQTLLPAGGIAVQRP
jgi:predicted ribosome quality control (RQC) complex YloA/Tae2 family protein